jgi:hypothetical protein
VLNAQTASYVLTAQTASYVLTAQTASFVANAQSASNAAAAQTASYVLNAVSSSFASTASSADNFLVRSTLTAQTLVVQTITSSEDFVTGSTRFGTIAANTHQFTGSVIISGSMQFSNSSTITTNAGTGFLAMYANGGGLYFGGAASTNHMMISSSGNVGIGTISPSRTLDVTGTLRVVTPNRSFFVTSNAYSISDGTLSSGIGMDGDGLYLGNVTSTTGWTIANPQVTIRSSGNVGIGKINPSEIFDVNTGQGARGGMALTGEYPYLRFNVSSSSANARNWALNATNAEAGDFALLQSNAKDGNPVTAGTSILGFSRGGAATFSSFIQATGLYGKSYPQTSTSGNVSIVDTGIYNSIDYSSGMIWLVSYGGNPLAAGSNYFANYLGALSVTTGYIGGSVKQYIQYSPISQFDASGVGALSLTAVFWNGTTELTTIPNSNTSYQIRLKIGTYNPVGSGQYVYLLKMG